MRRKPNPYLTMLTPSLIFKAYMSGIFPMSESRDDTEVFWLRPEFRGIFPLDQFHIPKSVRKMIKKSSHYVTINHDFRGTIKGCIEAKNQDRKDTWINPNIEQVFIKLHDMGHAHSFETRNENGDLIGGMYGLAIGSAFFGESMFSKISSASKFALVACYIYLKKRHFTLFDTQFVNDHLKQFGCIEIPQNTYEDLLQQAITDDISFMRPPPKNKIYLLQELL